MKPLTDYYREKIPVFISFINWWGHYGNNEFFNLFVCISVYYVCQSIE